MRARSLKPGVFANELLGTADPLLTLLFEGLWCLGDREGRLEDRPLRIKAQVFPYREIDTEPYLAELQRMGFVDRYQVGNLRIIQVLNFTKHQAPHPKEKVSELPSREKVRPSTGNSGTSPSDVLTPDVLTPDLKPSSAGAPAALDPRHIPTRNLIQQLHRERFRVVCDWDASEGNTLQKLLAAHPAWTQAELERMIENHFASENIPPSR